MPLPFILAGAVGAAIGGTIAAIEAGKGKKELMIATLKDLEGASGSKVKFVPLDDELDDYAGEVSEVDCYDDLMAELNDYLGDHDKKS